MQTTALSPFGVEILGFDLREPLHPGDEQALRGMMAAHSLLLFREQDITGADQKRVVTMFGPVLDESGDGRGYTLVSNTATAGRLGDGSYLFHSDLAFTSEPIRYLSLCAIDVPADGSPTVFADGRRAAAELPLAVRATLEGRDAVHVFDLRSSAGDQRFRIADLPDDAPRATHPVLLEHPGTGDTVLYVSEMQTDHVLGLEREVSDALLGMAYETLYAPAACYEHRWQSGDLVIWDNIALQHSRGAIAPGTSRTLRRVPVGTLAVTLQSS